MGEIQCLPCGAGSHPSQDGSRCEPCETFPILTPDPEGTADESLIPVVDSCNCTQSGGVCLPSNLGIGDRFTPSSSDEIVKFTTDEVHSAFFKEHVKVAAYMCYVRKTALPGTFETKDAILSYHGNGNVREFGKHSERASRICSK